VDCAYYSDELQEVDLDPGTELKQLLQARGLENLEASCPQCFENQQKLVSRSPHTVSLLCFILIHLLQAGKLLTWKWDQALKLVCNAFSTSGVMIFKIPCFALHTSLYLVLLCYVWHTNSCLIYKHLFLYELHVAMISALVTHNKVCVHVQRPR